MFSGGTQRRALPGHQSEDIISQIKIKYLIYLEWGSNPQPVTLTVNLCGPAPRWPRTTRIYLTY